MFSNTVKNKTDNKEVPVCVLANPGKNSRKKTREVSCASWISKQDKEGIIAFYEALVSRKELKSMNIEIIHETFSEFEDIDVHMILKEAFPRFEETIGEENFGKVKKYFGIGCKPNKKMNSKEIDTLISNLRTIENAECYICGYKKVISKLASLLEGVEEYQYSDIVKAKIIRMYSVIFFGYIYFAEDFTLYKTVEGIEPRIDYVRVNNNNGKGFYPEELFVLYLTKFTATPEKSFFYDVIWDEIAKIKERDQNLYKEILKFGELGIENGRFVSKNTANPYQNFGKIRGIKQKVHCEPGSCPIECFTIKSVAAEIDWGDLYAMYKNLKYHDLKDLKQREEKFTRYEGSRLIKDTQVCYEVIPETIIGGEYEKGRYIRLVETFKAKGLSMYLNYDLKSENKLKKPKKYDVSHFLSAIKFVKEANLVSGETTVQRDFEIADMLIKRDKKRILCNYSAIGLTTDEVKLKLGIDETLEFEFFGIKPKIEHKDVIAKFALENGYIESEDEINEENNQNLIQELIISGNEELIERYSSGEIDDEKFKKKIGFTEEFAEMFFNLSKVNTALIEEKLLEVKKSTVGKKKFDSNLKLVILLYCYIMDGQITCGPKNRVPKRNKALKTSILKTLV